MGMYESATGINEDLKSLFRSIPIKEFSENQREQILNIFIRFGQVAKFRCRSNTAYDNFVNACFQSIAKTERVESKENSEWKTLRAFYINEVK